VRCCAARNTARTEIAQVVLMIERDHPQLSIRRQAKMLKVNRNRLKPKRGRISEQDERIEPLPPDP